MERPSGECSEMRRMPGGETWLVRRSMSAPWWSGSLRYFAVSSVCRFIASFFERTN
jgi:hypothetical protein